MVNAVVNAGSMQGRSSGSCILQQSRWWRSWRWCDSVMVDSQALWFDIFIRYDLQFMVDLLSLWFGVFFLTHSIWCSIRCLMRRSTTMVASLWCNSVIHAWWIHFLSGLTFSFRYNLFCFTLGMTQQLKYSWAIGGSGFDTTIYFQYAGWHLLQLYRNP